MLSMDDLDLTIDPEAIQSLSLELTSILSESDRLLIALLVEQPAINQNENPFDMFGSAATEGSQQLIMVASDLRAKLKKSMECASAMYNSNMLCFSTILRLRKELSDTNSKHKQQIDAVQHRMEGLLNVVETQSKKLQESESTFRLKGLWNKLLSQASNDQFNDALSCNKSDECATAMSVLTALCAKEMQTQNTVTDGELEVLGDSLIQNLLTKVNEVKEFTEKEMRSVEDENNCLRLAIGEKGALIELISEREAGLLEELDSTKKQMNDLKSLMLEYEARALHAEEAVFNMKSEISLISEKLSNTQQAYSLMTSQYQEVSQYWSGRGSARATLNDINAKVLEATQQIKKLTPDKSKQIADSMPAVPSHHQQPITAVDHSKKPSPTNPPTKHAAHPSSKSNNKAQQRPPWVSKVTATSLKKHIHPRNRRTAGAEATEATKRWDPEWYKANQLLHRQPGSHVQVSDSPNENQTQNTSHAHSDSVGDSKPNKYDRISPSNSFTSEVAEAMSIINSLKSTWDEDE